MDWEAVIKLAFLSNLQATLSSGEADPDDATSWSLDYEAVVPGGYQPDVVIHSDAGSDYVVEMKYYDDPSQDVHFGSIAHLAASTRALEQSSGKAAKGILVTNADVTESIRQLAADMSINVYRVDFGDPDDAASQFASQLFNADHDSS